jgi:hypothetical protein
MRAITAICNQDQSRIRQTYQRFQRRMIFSSFGELSQESKISILLWST